MPHANQSSTDSFASYAAHDYARSSTHGHALPDARLSLSDIPVYRPASSSADHQQLQLQLQQQRREQASRKRTSLANTVPASFAAFRSRTPSFDHGPRSPSSRLVNSIPGEPPLGGDVQHGTAASYGRPLSTESRLRTAEARPLTVNGTAPTPSPPPRRSHGHTHSLAASHATHESLSSVYSTTLSDTTHMHINAQHGLQKSAQGQFLVPPMAQASDEARDEDPLRHPNKQQQQQQQHTNSPVLKLGSLFGWKTTPAPAADSPTSLYSDNSPQSPSRPPSPAPITNATMKPTRPIPAMLDLQHTHRELSPPSAVGFSETPLLLGTAEQNAHARELEKELQYISSELASSIRREMELEDELERMRNDNGPVSSHDGLNRRSSDYFSDSGTSSTRFPVLDSVAQIEKFEGLRRKAEQEKAQIKLQMSDRFQAELGRRKELEQLVQELEEQLHKSLDRNDEQTGLQQRLEEVESLLANSKRQLNDERTNKDNFDMLYAALRDELEMHKNERDNLKDEVVPQLKARVEGLEAALDEKRSLVYEHARVQQELQQARDELWAIKEGKFTSISEEGAPASTRRYSLSRSNSAIGKSSHMRGSLSRSSSVREGHRPRSGSIGIPQAVGTTGPLNAEGVRELEEQRDALQQALKLVIRRHEKQKRDHERAITKLTKAKDRAEAGHPKRRDYHNHVALLKEEVSTLRKRTEDALEQKWEYEKGLSGLKMDLDRAEEETRGLRIILDGQEVGSPLHEEANQNLKLSIINAEDDLDHALQAAAFYREHARSMQGSPEGTELASSAERMMQLAKQLEQHVQSTLYLREKLSQFVAQGEHDQKQSLSKINEMQGRIASLEDSVLTAQHHSETALGDHEAEIRRIDEATSPSLQRLRVSMPEPPKRISPLSSPLFSPMFRSKSPKLGGGGRPSASTLFEMSRAQALESKVRELEHLLREAEQDMQAVVAKVNTSQIEVNTLQEEKDAAVAQMRKVQRLLTEERERAAALM